MVKTAYLSLFVSLILFLAYFIINRFNLAFNSNILFYLSAIILLVSIFLFNKLNIKQPDIFIKKSGTYDEVLKIRYDKLQIKKLTYGKSENNYEYDDIDFNRVDLLFSHDVNSKHLNRCFIVYVSETIKNSYYSQPLNIDIKTLEIKLYQKKHINIYIDTISGNYFFGLDFLN